MEKKGLMWFLRILLLLWLLIGSWLWGRHICETRANATTEQTDIIEPIKGFSAIFGDFKTTADSYFRFAKDSTQYEPLSDKLQLSLDKTATFLKNNTDKALNITGYYADSEENASLFPDLGVARANTIKGDLELRGVSPAQLTTTGELANADNMQEGYIRNGIEFDFEEKSDDADARLERIRENIVGNPLMVYFNSGDQSINLTTEQKDNFADMIYFLDRVEGSNIEIGGHTDSQGEDRGNKRLSRKRAESVASYVMQGGISESRITAVGYGEEQPIGDNKYEAGREKNRRVEIILQE